MKKFVLAFFLLLALPSFLGAQEECNPVAAIPNLSSDCTDPESPMVAFDGTFSQEHSGTSAMEYIFTAPADENGEEEVIWVSPEFDLDMNDDGTGTPYPYGTYGVTPFAYDAEDLMALASNSVILTLVDCLEGDGSDSLDEVLSCIEATEGLVNGVLTIDLVQMNVLDSVAPLLLQYDMCYELGEKIEFVYSESCISAIGDDDSLIESIVSAEFGMPNVYRISDEVARHAKTLNLYSNSGQLLRTLSTNEPLIDLNAFPRGSYFLGTNGVTWRQSQKVLRF